LARQHGDPEKAAVALMTLARLARAEGDYSRAVALFEESLAGHALKRGFSAFIQYELGIATIDQGDYPRATAIFQELMTKYQESRWTLPAGLEGLRHDFGARPKRRVRQTTYEWMSLLTPKITDAGYLPRAPNSTRTPSWQPGPRDGR
jgi:tetratricopeptide (TPR) repeat protein